MNDARAGVLGWAAATRDVIALHRSYVRLCGDIGAGAVLSQVLYWFDDGPDGNPRVRVGKRGQLWLARSAAELADELGLVDGDGVPRAKVARRYLRTLEDAGLVVTAVHRFNGKAVLHVRPCWEVLAERLASDARLGYAGRVSAATPETGIPECPNGNPGMPERANH